VNLPCYQNYQLFYVRILFEPCQLLLVHDATVATGYLSPAVSIRRNTDGWGIQESMNENMENIWLMTLQIICTVEFVSDLSTAEILSGLSSQ